MSLYLLTEEGKKLYNLGMKSSDEKQIVTGRFAPTPSGRMHLGNIFTAMIAYLNAKSQKGRCLLRIEDLDKLRCPLSSAAEIIDDLKWFGFSFDGEIEYQSKRTSVYERETEKLEKAGLVYPCYCSRAQLHAATAPHGETPVYDGRCRFLKKEDRPLKSPCLRVIVPDETIAFTDGIMGEYKQNLKKECGDFIIRRSDGVYAYQLAVVADDALQNVTEVVRGRDLISSAPRQIYLFRTLGYKPPRFLHVPLITDANGERLSKREGKSNLVYIRSAFPSPEPVIGMLAYNAGLIEKFAPVTLNRLIDVYDVSKISKKDIALDPCGLF